MRLARSVSLFLLVVVIIGLFAYIYFLQRQLNQINQSLPVSLRSAIPSSWAPFTGPNYFRQCDLDGDPSNGQETLLLYRYDQSAGQPGLIGGVVYTREVNRVPQQLGVESPYRPAVLIPYKLLPDIYEGKGQGYLGETDAQVRLWPATPAGQTGCQAREIVVFGSRGSFWTRISIFRWNADLRRYDGVHFAADTQILPVPGPANAPQLVNAVTTYDSFDDRSALCRVRSYIRAGNAQLPPANLNFSENVDSFTIDFCYGPPVDPAYPEAVIVALLRNPNLPGAANPIGSGYFLNDQVRSAVPNELAPLKAPGGWTPYRILTVRNQGLLGAYPAEGSVIPNPQAAASGPWWQGAEQAMVQTSIVLADGQPHDFTWHLVSVANEQVVADTRWRIVDVRPTQP